MPMPSFASVTVQQTRPNAIVKNSHPPTGHDDCERFALATGSFDERFGASHRRVAVRLTIAAEGPGETPVQRMDVTLIQLVLPRC